MFRQVTGSVNGHMIYWHNTLDLADNLYRGANGTLCCLCGRHNWWLAKYPPSYSGYQGDIWCSIQLKACSISIDAHRNILAPDLWHKFAQYCFGAVMCSESAWVGSFLGTAGVLWCAAFFFVTAFWAFTVLVAFETVMSGVVPFTTMSTRCRWFVLHCWISFVDLLRNSLLRYSMGFR